MTTHDHTEPPPPVVADEDDRLLLGIDVGSSVAKAALFDGAGRELAAEGLPIPHQRPLPGWSEVDMLAVWQQTSATVRTLLARTDDAAARVAAVGVTGCMVGAWMVDAAGRPVRNAILWNDGRAQPLIDALTQVVPDLVSRIFDEDGCVLQQGCTLPVLAWLAQHEPEALASARHVFGSKDWVRYRLTGSIASDQTEAAVAPGDIRNRNHSRRMLALFGLEQHAGRLPPAQPSHGLAGAVTEATAAETGLMAGTPVAIGAGDVPSSAIGVGAVAPGQACTILGTTCLTGAVVPDPVFEPRDTGLLFCLPGSGWLRTMVNVAGTTNLDWALARFLPGAGADRFDRLERMAGAVAPGADGLLYLPYLSDVGVIAPIVEVAARAEFFGLTDQHETAHLLRAVLEGLAFAIRDCLEAMPTRPSELRLSGGGGRSATWCRIIADVTGHEVLIPEGSEFGARGAALLAGVATGRYPSLIDAVTGTDRIARRYPPDPAIKATYDRAFATYRRLRDALRPVWRSAADRGASAMP